MLALHSCVRTLSLTPRLCGQKFLSPPIFTPKDNFHFCQKLFSESPQPSTTDLVPENEDTDTLIRKLTIEVQGHDRAVIESYQKFMSMAMQGFNFSNTQVIDKPKFIWKNTVLKSVHVHKKHRVQYETRNHYKVFEVKHLTGSTASTFLEYVQRNLPEGVAMKVTTQTVEKLPEHLTSSG